MKRTKNNPKTKTAQINAAVEASLLERVDKIANSRYWTRADVAYIAITQFVDRELGTESKIFQEAS